MDLLEKKAKKLMEGESISKLISQTEPNIFDDISTQIKSDRIGKLKKARPASRKSLKFSEFEFE
jgi:hypothetical protein